MEDPNEPQSPGEREPPRLTGGPGGLELPDRLSFLRNRFILAGMGVLVILLLITIVLVTLGSDDDGLGEISAASDSTPEAVSTVDLETGVSGRMLATATMRIGPDTRYAILGTIPRGALVSVVGRNADANWLQVVYPPSSQLRGWIPAEAVELTGDLSELVIAGPGEGPSILIPTSEAPVVYFTATPPPAPPIVSATPTVQPEPTPQPTATTPSTNTPPPPTATTPPVPTNTPPVPPTVTPGGR